MSWENYINPAEVKKAISILLEPGKVFECRIVETARKGSLSGYFRDADTLLKALDSVDVRKKNIYITLNEVKEECFSRAQSGEFLRAEQTTSDPDITKYRWLFVDLDPVRTAGISSTDAELKYAEELAEKVYGYMSELGFREPVRALSGNGYHLLYRIDFPNDPTGRALVEKCLKVLAGLFSTEQVKIDTTNSNPARICKLHGTLAQKGANTNTRPHRMSRILSAPEPVEVSGVETLQRLAAELPDEPQQGQPRRGGYSQQSEFDLLDFMNRAGMTYKEDSNDRAKIYRLDECPFDPSHKNGDARIFQYSNGAIAFKCHHNSCHQYKWQDVRLKYDPEAYTRTDAEDARIDAGYREHIKKKSAESIEQSMTPQKITPAKKPRVIRKLKKAEELMQKNLPEPRVFIGVGEELPMLVEGTCILSAKPKLGKSWLALSICIKCANGEDFLGYKTRKCSTLYLDLETSETLQQRRLKKVLQGEPVPKNFYLETETDNLENGFCEQIEAYLKEDPNIGIVVIDVFQIIRSAAKSAKETEYEHAYRDITPLNEIAQKYHISIILVCHDRKAVDPDDPFSNILGSTGLQGAATQMMVMFRKRKDDPVHISVKGKTIDGLPELDVKLENAQWSIVSGVNTAERERAELLDQFRASNIRVAVCEIAKNNKSWRGRCAELINLAIGYGVPLEETPKQVGGFLHRHQGRFLSEDGIQILVIDNGTGPKIYKIQKAPLITIDTIDENKKLPLMGFEKADDTGDLEIPFL